MEYVSLGKTGLKVSRVGLGTWQFSYDWGVLEYERAKAVIHKALELGINFFDTAMVYGMGLSEYFLGKALKEAGVSRDSIVISTKVPGQFLNRDDVLRSVEKSLKLLGLDHVDILLAHWPPCWHHFPTREYAKAMEQLVKMGKVSYLGLSDFPVELVESFISYLSVAEVVALQVRYNLIERWAEEELIPYAEKHGMVVQAWSPIAKGALTGKYTPENLPKFEDVRSQDPVFHPKNFAKVWELVKKLEEVGAKYGKKPVQVALNWLIMSSPIVIPIPGAKTPEQVVDIAGSVGWRLSFEDWRLIDELSKSIKISYSIYYVERSFE